MRILVVTDFPSGKQSFVDDSIAALRDYGHTVEALNLQDDRGFETNTGIRDAHGLAKISGNFRLSVIQFSALVIRLLAWGLSGPNRARFIHNCARFSTMGIQLGVVRAAKYVEAAKEISIFSPDVIHVHFAWNVTYMLSIASYLKIPIVVTAHGSDILKREEWKNDLNTEEVAGVACVSQYLKDRIDSIPSLSNKTTFVPNSINSVFFKPTKQPSADISILCVASLRKLKNHQWLIRALKSLCQSGTRFTCRFVGEPLPGEEQHAESIKKQVREAGLEDVIEFTGWLDKSKVVDLVDQSTVCVLPSTSEGFGVFIIEALARARCAVVSDIPGCREAVSNGSYGVIVPLNSDEQLSQGIIEGHRITISELERMQHARDHVMLNYSPEAHAKSLTNIFNISRRA